MPSDDPKSPHMMSCEQLATVLGVSLTLAYRMCRRGEVPAIKAGDRWLIPRAKVAEMIGVDVEAI